MKTAGVRPLVFGLCNMLGGTLVALLTVGDGDKGWILVLRNDEETEEATVSDWPQW